MAITPEREPAPQVPESVTERPSEIPPEVERTPGVKRTPTQVAAQVTDDAGQQLIQTSATQQVTVQIPADPAQLDDWSKGSPLSALTWLAKFWLRMIKKAAHFGWRVVTGRGKS